MARVHIAFDEDKRGSFWGELPTDERTKHLAFPSGCPHCGGATQKTVRLATQWVPAQGQTLWVDIDTCKRVWQPAFVRMIGVVAGVMSVVTFFATVGPSVDAYYGAGAWTQALAPALFLVGFAALLAWALRAYFTLRFTHYNHKSMGFRFPRREYAEQFAASNRGELR